jgi:hypothetical protein
MEETLVYGKIFRESLATQDHRCLLKKSHVEAAAKMSSL